MADDELVISYNLKDVLARLEGKLDQTLASLNHKADNTRVDAVELRVLNAETRLTAIEQSRVADQKARDAEDHVLQRREQWKQWIIPTLCTVVLVLIAVLQFLHV